MRKLLISAALCRFDDHCSSAGGRPILSAAARARLAPLPPSRPRMEASPSVNSRIDCAIDPSFRCKVVTRGYPPPPGSTGIVWHRRARPLTSPMFAQTRGRRTPAGQTASCRGAAPMALARCSFRCYQAAGREATRRAGSTGSGGTGEDHRGQGVSGQGRASQPVHRQDRDGRGHQRRRRGRHLRPRAGDAGDAGALRPLPGRRWTRAGSSTSGRPATAAPTSRAARSSPPPSPRSTSPSGTSSASRSACRSTSCSAAPAAQRMPLLRHAGRR